MTEGMATKPEGRGEGGERYLIRKGGYFYRPNAQGYTGCKAEAGRYTLEEAVSLTHPNGPDGPRDDLSYMLDDTPTPSKPEGLPEGMVAWAGGQCPLAADNELARVVLTHLDGTTRVREGKETAGHFDSLGWWTGKREDGLPTNWRITGYWLSTPTKAVTAEGQGEEREAFAKIIGDGIYGPTRSHIYRHVTLPLADAIIAHRQAAQAELVEALKTVTNLFALPGENSVERFDRLARWFYRDTGYMAPGKDQPRSGVVASADRDDLNRIYDEWFAGKVANARATLAKLGADR